MKRKTKIIATIGPATGSAKKIKELVDAGADVLRINTSHGNSKKNQELVNLIKSVRKSMNGKPLPILLDTRGPELRIGKFKDGAITLKKGDVFTFTTDTEFVGNAEKVAILQPEAIRSIKIGQLIYAADQLLRFRTIKVSTEEIICKVQCGGEFSSNKSLYIPGFKLEVPYLNEKDKEDILWAIDSEVDFIAASFVNSKKDVIELRNFLKQNNSNAEIIAKVESKLALKNLDEIINEADAVMIARGDLGSEIPQEKLPEWQKTIIKKCRRAGKMVITASEMLESMITNGRPTRAETSDVANAVYDGTNVVMLSGETAVGLFPRETVEIMAKICIETENNINYNKRFIQREVPEINASDVMSNAAVHISFKLKGIKAIALYSDSGHTAKMLSRFHPSCPIIALTPNADTYQRLNMVWGTTPLLSPKCTTADQLIKTINDLFITNKIAKPGDTILIGTGSRTPSDTDMIKVHKLSLEV